jgi:hypothetical protein
MNSLKEAHHCRPFWRELASERRNSCLTFAFCFVPRSGSERQSEQTDSLNHTPYKVSDSLNHTPYKESDSLNNNPYKVSDSHNPTPY